MIRNYLRGAKENLEKTTQKINKKRQHRFILIKYHFYNLILR